MKKDVWRPTASLGRLRLVADLRAGIRAWMAERDVLEVVTPVLSHAAPTDLHLDAFRTGEPDVPGATRNASVPAPLWLQTSPEYPMKRLLAAHGVDVHQIAPVFRAGERGRRHNPEFTMLEWYRVGMDHVALMDDVTDLLATLWRRRGRAWHPPERRCLHDVVDAVLGEGAAGVITVNEIGEAGEAGGTDAGSTGRGFASAPSGDPRRVPFVDVERVRRHFETEGRSYPASIGADADAALDLLLDEFVLPTLPDDRVTFLHGWPLSQAALARVAPDARGRLVAERFELYVGALELGNGYHELSDAREQRTRFERDLAARAALGREVLPVDEHLLAALESGLPDCAGVAVGLERLAMALFGHDDIDDVLSFGIERA